MTDNTLAEFYNSLIKLAKSYEEKNIILKIHPDFDANVIRIYGENTDSVERAKSGLEELSDLAYATAEHHPFWNLIYNSSQISKLVLEKWRGEMTKEELDEISWCVDELKNTCTKLREKQSHC